MSYIAENLEKTWRVGTFKIRVGPELCTVLIRGDESGSWELVEDAEVLGKALLEAGEYCNTLLKEIETLGVRMRKYFPDEESK